MKWVVIYELQSGVQSQLPPEDLDGAVETARSLCDRYGADLAWVQLEPAL